MATCLGILAGCDGLDRDRQRALDAIEAAIRTIEDNSKSWQEALQGLERDLDEDMRSIISHELSDMLGKQIGLLGVEARCEATFVRDQIRNELVRARAALLGEPPSPRAPFVCATNPTALDYSHLPATLQFFGWDLDLGQGVEAVVVDRSGAEARVEPKDLTTADIFLLTVDLSPAGVPLAATTEKLLLRSGGGVVHDVIVHHGEVGPRCDDGVRNGEESDVDCGGPCDRCGPGQICRREPDCRDSICRSQRCGLVFVGESLSPSAFASAGGAGGSDFSERCPPDHVVIGFELRTGNYVDALAPICAFLRTDGMLSESHLGRWHGGAGGDRLTKPVCDGAVTGLGLRKDNYVDQINLICRPPLDIVDGREAPATTTTGGGGGGGDVHNIGCPAGSLVTGIAGRSGNVIDHIGIFCSRLDLR